MGKPLPSESDKGKEKQCRVCGCTDINPCVTCEGEMGATTCHWVANDLCSTCAPVAAIEAFLGHLAVAVEEFREMLGRRA